MNDPQSTIDDFASRLTDLSLLTPLHTHHPRHVDNTFSMSPKSRNKLSLPCLLQTILTSISQNALPLDPTLPILHTPHTVPLKRIRPSADASALLPHLGESFDTLPEHTAAKAERENGGEAEDEDEDEDEQEHEEEKSSIPTLIPGDDPFPQYLTLQIDHLTRVSHYNYTTYEVTSTRTRQHTTHEFLDELFSLLDDTCAFRARYGCEVRSLETVSLLAGHKPARETVVPIGNTVFVHTRSCGKIGALNTGCVSGIKKRVRREEGEAIRFRVMSTRVLLAWGVCLSVIGGVIGAVIWVWKGGLLVTALAFLQLLLLALILSLGVGQEFRGCVGVLFGWRNWVSESDVIRDCGEEGRDALVAGLWSGDGVDDLVSGFGFGQGVRLREWCYDPRFGVVVGEKCGFAIRGRRWFRVVREKDGKSGGRYKLFPGGKRKAFVGVHMGVRVVDGGRKREVV